MCRSRKTLALEGIAAFIGSIGDACDNALVESTIGLFKNESIREGSPFRAGPLKTIDDVEWTTARAGRLVQQPATAPP